MSALHERIMVSCGAWVEFVLFGTSEAVPFPKSVQCNSVYFASGVGTEILRWESLASRAAPLPQDDNSWDG
jgi:hypothetical protein